MNYIGCFELLLTPKEVISVDSQQAESAGSSILITGNSKLTGPLVSCCCLHAGLRLVALVLTDYPDRTAMSVISSPAKPYLTRSRSRAKHCKRNSKHQDILILDLLDPFQLERLPLGSHDMEAQSSAIEEELPPVYLH